MKRLASLLALASLLTAPALADQMGGGISGTVVDIHTGQPIAGATVLYYRTPWVENSTRVMQIKTDRNGHFSDITLEPGRYIIMSHYANQPTGCAVDDIMTGEVAKIKIQMGRDRIVCTGPRVHPTLVDPNATASVYRI